MNSSTSKLSKPAEGTAVCVRPSVRPSVRAQAAHAAAAAAAAAASLRAGRSKVHAKGEHAWSARGAALHVCLAALLPPLASVLKHNNL